VDTSIGTAPVRVAELPASRQRDAEGRTWVTACSNVLEDTVLGVAERAISALTAEHDRFTSARHYDGGPSNGNTLLAAADTARNALATLIAFRDVDHGPAQPPYTGLR
jgi:hypothetical protein